MSIKKIVSIILIISSISLSSCSSKIERDIQEDKEINHTDTFVRLNVTPTQAETNDIDSIDGVDITEEIDNNKNTGSGLQRDIIAESAKINSDNTLTDEESRKFDNLDFSKFKTEAAINVMKQLLKSENKENFEMFNVTEYYSNDIPTTVYYITMDNEHVHYIYEQNNTAYSLPDEHFNYNEVLKLIEEDKSGGTEQNEE